MKKLFTLLAIITTITIFAQAPQGFNYQATVRNSSGQLLLNQDVLVKFNILKNSATGDIVYSETQTANTDDLGQINLVVGQGTAPTGTFSAINWGTSSYYLGIELNSGSGYVAMGTTQLLSVPYALYANSSATATTVLAASQPVITNVGTLTSATVNGKVIIGALSAASPSAVLEANSTTQGFLPPRMTSIQRDAIVSPAVGLVIFNTTSNCLNFYIASGWNETCGSLIGKIGSLECSSVNNTGTLTSNTPANGVFSNVSYTNGNGGFHNGQIISSSGIIGLTATLAPSTFNNGSGMLIYEITGTPISNGTAIFELNIGGQICNISILVNIFQPSYPNGTVFCNGADTIVVDVVNPSTGKTWMNKNLSGHYQWGRSSDGHQCISSPVVTTLSSSVNPSGNLYGKFINPEGYPFNWLTSNVNTLWQGVNGTNNPCPSGYRIPTSAEWNTERLSWSSQNATGAYNSPLKLLTEGKRYIWQGSPDHPIVYQTLPVGNYWSSTGGTSGGNIKFNNSSPGVSENAQVSGANKYEGQSVRCIKD